MTSRRLGLAGLPGSGKDTTLRLLVDDLGLKPAEYELLAVGDSIKEAATRLIVSLRDGAPAAAAVAGADIPIRRAGQAELGRALAGLSAQDVATASGFRRSEGVRRLLQVLASDAVKPGHWDGVIERFCDRVDTGRWLFVNGVRRVTAADALRARGFTLINLHLAPERCALRLQQRDGATDRGSAIGHHIEWQLQGYPFDHTIEVWDHKCQRERSPEEVAREAASVLADMPSSDCQCSPGKSVDAGV